MKNYQSKIEKLISELCPNGVEFLKITELALEAFWIMPATPKFVSDKGIPYITSKNIRGGHIDFSNIKNISKESYIDISKNRPIIKDDILISMIGTIGEVARVKATDLNFYGQNMYLVRLNQEKINISYFLHFFDSKKMKDHFSSIKNNSSQGYLKASHIELIKIPIPPIAVQEEIVKILDSFTQLEAELEAELEARKKQYEYYKKFLLTHSDSMKEIALGDIGKVSMCKRIFKNQTSLVGDIPFYKIGTFGKKPNAFISKEIFEEYRDKYSFPKKGDILLSASGTIGRSVIFDGTPSYFQDSNIIWIDNNEDLVLNKFLYYLYSILEWKTEGGTIKRLYNDNLKKIKILIPPIKEQERIVSILDKFDALVNDISIGLPAELEARRKQYEYYRNQLLTFKELEK